MEWAATLNEYEKLVIRMNTPRVVIDNTVCATATLVKVDSGRKHGILLEAVQVLTDLNLCIKKAYISSDGQWFMVVLISDGLSDYGKKLLQVPILPGHVYAINDSLSAEGAADDYEACLRHLVKAGIIELSKATGFPKFDLMLLGMGPDGHVASLFPGHPIVNENQKWVTFIKDSPKPPPERITFTFPVINSSEAIAMVVNGAGKAEAVRTALGDQQSSISLPVQMVSPEGELTWFTDKEAMSKLQEQSSL